MNSPGVTKFTIGMHLHDVWVDPENQGHRSKVKVMRSNDDFVKALHLFRIPILFTGIMSLGAKVKGH